jgi:hypothetical protein
LLQIDVDGTTRILGTQSVNYQTPEVIKLLNVYPIPMQEVLNIDVFVGTGDATLIQLYDIKGDLVREEKKYTSTGTQTFSLHVEDLPRGVYCYKVSNPLTLIIGKVIKE